MELLGGYGDDDESEQEKEQEEDESGLPGFESFRHREPSAGKKNEGEGSQNISPAASAASSVPERLRGAGTVHGQANDSDATPGGPGRLRHHRFKVVSKAGTPVLHGSPALYQNMPSDESTPNSPSRKSGWPSVRMPAAAVPLPEKPDGEVDRGVSQRVDHYMRLRGKPEPVKVNRDLYDKKEFHNPGILEMLMSQYTIIEAGSNYPPDLFDPKSYPDILYYDKLRHLPAGRRAQEVSQTGDGAAKRTLVQHVVVSGSAQPARQGAADAAAAAAAIVASRLAGAAGSDAVPRKKTKWDSSKVSKPPLASSLGGAPSINLPSTGIAALDFERIRQLTRK